MKRYFKLIALFTCVIFIATSCSTDYDYDFKDGVNDPGLDKESISVDTNSMSYVDRSLFNKASIFPGLVDETFTRVTDFSVTVDVREFPVDKSIYRISHAPLPIYSTGLYAPTGGLLEITVPAGVNNLSVQIGAHEDNLSSIVDAPRDVSIFTRKQLFPGKNYIRSPYGGIVWVKASASFPNIIELKVTGAVETADYIAGKSNFEEWRARLMSSNVPWLELRGKRSIWTVPTNRLKSFVERGVLTDVDKVLSLWDEIYEKDYYQWMGLSEHATDLKHRFPVVPERSVADIKPSTGYAHSGFPWVYQDDNYWMDEILNVKTITKGASWGSYHEVGHNYQQTSVWSFDGLGETTNNLFVFKGAWRHGVRVGNHSEVRNRFPEAVANASKYDVTNPSNTAGGFVPTHYSARANGDGAPFYRLTPFVQIFQKLRDPDNPTNTEFGWGFMTYLYTKARNAEFIAASDLDKRDFVYEALCEYGKRDYAHFFGAWGIVLSDFSKTAMAAKYPRMTTKLWEYQPLDGTGGNVTF